MRPLGEKAGTGGASSQKVNPSMRNIAPEDVAFAQDLCNRGVAASAHINAIIAEDEAECERSIFFGFTPAESADIFAAIDKILKKRPKP